MKRHQRKNVALNASERREALKALDRLIVKYRGDYQKIADLLGYTYAYIHLLANRNMPPGRPFAEKVAQLDPGPPPKPRKRTPMVAVAFKDDEERRMVLEAFTPEDRRDILVDALSRSTRNLLYSLKGYIEKGAD